MLLIIVTLYVTEQYKCSRASPMEFVTRSGIATRNGMMRIAHVRRLLENAGMIEIHERIPPGATARLATVLNLIVVPAPLCMAP